MKKFSSTGEVNSISQTELDIDDSMIIGIIYSITDVFDYSVEIRHQGKSTFIKESNELEQFDNLENAKSCAYKNGATKLYLATSLVYDEVGTGKTDTPPRRFDYMPIQ